MAYMAVERKYVLTLRLTKTENDELNQMLSFAPDGTSKSDFVRQLIFSQHFMHRFGAAAVYQQLRSNINQSRKLMYVLGRELFHAQPDQD